MEMLDGLTDSAINRYKTILLGFVIVTSAAMYVLYMPWSPPGEWIKHLESIRVAVMHSVRNRSDVFLKNFNVILRGYNRHTSTNGSATTTDATIAPPEGPEVNKSGRYVSMCSGNFDGRRIGNQLFNFAAMLHVARLTGRRVAMVRRHPNGWLDRWFEVPVTRVDHIANELCPFATVGEAAGLLYYHQMSTLFNRSDVAGKSLLVCGWFQSWKYTVGIESALGHHLRLLPNVSAAVHSFLDQIRPSTWKGQSFSRIGIHVRAGDVMRRDKWDFGYTIPQRPYFEQAMSRFVSEQTKGQQQTGRVQFVVTSDSLQWAKTAINFTQIVDRLNQTYSSSSSSSSRKQRVLVDVAYSEGQDAGFDLALLSLCDGVIMSTGTYGWWGAWLANKTTIYYSNWPRAGSPISGIFNRDDYFPPHWIPIGGPAFPCCQG